MDIAKRVRDQLSSVRRALATARVGVAQIRKMVADLQYDREKTRAAPVPIDEAIAALDGMLRHWRVAGQEWFSLDAVIAVASRGEQPALVDPHAMKTATLLRVMLLTLGDQVRETLIRQLEAHYAGVEVGLPADARAARLREIDRELAGLEQAEEVAIAAAEEGGLAIDRRPDASVEAVLGINT